MVQYSHGYNEMNEHEKTDSFFLIVSFVFLNIYHLYIFCRETPLDVCVCVRDSSPDHSYFAISNTCYVMHFSTLMN